MNCTHYCTLDYCDGYTCKDCGWTCPKGGASAPSLADCTCGYRHRTDGCSEWSCIYHGEENRTRSIEMRRACPVHTADENGAIVRREGA